MQFKKNIFISALVVLLMASTTPFDIQSAHAAAYGFVQAQYQSRASGLGHAFTTNNVAGNAIIVSVAWFGSGTPTITDTKGNTYTLAQQKLAGGVSICVWVAYNIAAGANTVTVTLAGMSFDATYLEYSGLVSTDQVAGGSATGGTPSSGNTPTTTQANEMVFGFIANNNGSPAAGTGFTSQASGVNNYYVRAEDKRVTATGAQSATFGAVTGTWVAVAVTFKEATPPAIGTLYCTMRTASCNGGETEIYEMENATNAHAGLPSASYNNLICCGGVTGLGNACSGTFATALKLSGATNAHVRQGTLSDYASATDACLSVTSGGSITVGYQATNCTGFDTTLGAMIGTTNSHVGSSSWSGGTTKICATGISPPGNFTIDIVDAGGSSVASPSIAMGATSLSFSSQTSTGTFGTSSQKIRVTNTTGNALWTLSIAGSGGPTTLWSAGTPKYDFNDPTVNAVDGADTDSYGGRMTINPSGGTLGGTCATTGITKGSSTAFSEGVTDSITLLTAGGTANTACYWDFTNTSISQTLPAEQPANNYSMNMTMTLTAN